MGYVPSGFTVFAGVFLIGVGFADEGVGLTGVGPMVFLSALTEGFAGVLATGVFLMAVGRGFFVAAGVEVAGFEASLTAFFAGATAGFLTGVVVAVGLLAETVGNFFCVPSGVLALTGVAFAGACAVGAAGVGVDAPAAFSFLGTRLTGAVAVSILLAAAATGFLTGAGVALEAVDVAVLTGVVAVFFAACPVLPATLERLPTLAVPGVSLEWPKPRRSLALKSSGLLLELVNG
jgi:hypothetical protein